MPLSKIQNRRLGRVYVKAEATYGTRVTLAAANAIRHTGVTLNRKNNREKSTERYAHPSLLRTKAKRKTFEWSLTGDFYPSGTLATLCDIDAILVSAFGQVATKPATPLVTTVSASPTPTASTFTLTSATGLVKGTMGLLIVCSGGTRPGAYLRKIEDLTGSAVTVTPALPQAPASGDAVKSVVAYNLATAAEALSLGIAHYLSDTKYEGRGCVVESLKFDLDANNEIVWTASGSYAERFRSTNVQTDPVTQTLVGSNPPTGLVGYANLDDAVQEFLKASIELKNNYLMDNKSYGLSTARRAYRVGQRDVTIGLNAQATDDEAAMAAAEGGADHEVLIQTGDTEGKLVGLYMPAIDFEVPDDADGDGETEFAFNGTCKGVAGNDELMLILG